MTMKILLSFVSTENRKNQNKIVVIIKSSRISKRREQEKRNYLTIKFSIINFYFFLSLWVIKSDYTCRDKFRIFFFNDTKYAVQSDVVSVSRRRFHNETLTVGRR